MALRELISQEIASGFTHLVGTHVQANVVVTEAALRDMLRQFTNLPRSLQLRIETGNRLVLSYGAFNSGAVLADSIDLRQRRLQLWLDSAALGWALRYLVSAPGVHVKHRRISIDLEQLGVLRSYWHLVRRIGLSTAKGALHLRVELAVN